MARSATENFEIDFPDYQSGFVGDSYLVKQLSACCVIQALGMPKTRGIIIKRNN